MVVIEIDIFGYWITCPVFSGLDIGSMLKYGGNMVEIWPTAEIGGN